MPDLQEDISQYPQLTSSQVQVNQVNKMDSDTISTRIDKLDHLNYHAWKIRVQHVLSLKDLDEFLTEDPPATGLAAWKKKDKKAQALIGLSLSDELLENVREVTTAKEMWLKIRDVFERHTLLNKLSARRKFYTATKQDSETILQFANRIGYLASTLKSMGITVDQCEMAMALLNGLPEEYDPLISALDAVSSTEDETLKFDYIKARVMQEEQRISMRSDQAAIKTETAALLSNQGKVADRPRCTNCGKLGHLEDRCWKKHPHLNPHKRKQNAFFANGAKNDNESVVCLIAKHKEYALKVSEDPAVDWIIDSGCSKHMTHDRSLFSSYTPGAAGKFVELGNGNKSRILGEGTIRIKILVDGKNRTCLLTDACFVPELGYNLVSVPSLDKKGLTTIFENLSCIIKYQDVVLATGTMVGNLYQLDVETDHAFVASDLSLWHKRLAHIDPESIKTMSRQGFVAGINLEDADSSKHKCDDCIIGKGHRTTFPKQSKTKTSQLLELIHSDVNGPLEVPSLGNSRYFITFIDDFSRWTTVFMMRKKSDALECFKKFHSMVQNLTGSSVRASSTNSRPVTIKKLRTDNGGEYVSKEFKTYLTQNGIVHQTTIPYSPQQNGVAERMNRTLIDLVRSMIHSQHLEKSFWAEALRTAVYIRNRVISRSLPEGITPHHRWHGKAADLSHCRIFGCRCFYIIPKSKLRKLDPRARQAIFIGYLENSKGYKLWDVEEKRCIMSRDVKFHEEKTNIPARVRFDTTSRGGDTEAQLDVVDKSSTPRSDSDSEDGDEDPVWSDPTTDSNTTPADDTVDKSTTQPVQQILRRSARESKKTSEWWKASANVALSARVVPLSYKAATVPANIDFWKPGIDKEHDCLLRNNTWTLEKRRTEMHVLPSKYVFRVKNEGPKARVVAVGCHQLYGVDYLETFAPVVKLTTIRAVLALAAHYDLEVEQMDVITAFLNGDLKDEIYMEIPEGLRTSKNSGMVCKLRKSLYGLKQSPRQWYAKIHQYLTKDLRLCCSINDPCLYVRKTSSGILIVCLYVDDLLIVGNSKPEIAAIKGELSKRFEMKDLGPAKVMLGIEITRDRLNRKLIITQHEYTHEILRRFRMEECRTVSTPMDKSTLMELDTDGAPVPGNVPYRQAIGSLIYLVSCTRPDLAFTVRRLSQYLESPRKQHWEAVKRALRYLWTTRDYGILFDGRHGASVVGYSDSDYAGCTVTRKSTSGYVFLLAGGAISWKSKKQSVVTTSSCEAEYVASCMAAKEAIWLSRLIADLHQETTPAIIPIHVDNNGAKDLAVNATINERSKHIDVQYHFVRQSTCDGKISLERCDTADQVADPLTKPLDKQAHQKHCTSQGLRNFKT